MSDTHITILGCGSSGGVPRIGNDWGKCDPNNPKNLRNRCSILITKTAENGAETNVLIDTSPDLRNQLNASDTKHLDGVLYTHPHADHIHGIDDLRAIAINTRERVNVWADKPTSDMLLKRFTYCFETPKGSDYPPILNLHEIALNEKIFIDGAGGCLEILPFKVHHGRIDSLGFRVNDAVYIPDTNGIPDESLYALEGLDVWIIDALRETLHPSHLSFGETLDLIDQVAPKNAYITNMHVDMDYDFVAENSPENVQPCYDGLTIKI